MKTYQTKEGVEEYIKMCESYDNSEFENLIHKYLPYNSTILEIGMGSGNDYKWLSNHYEVTGSDYSELFIKKAKKRFPNGSFKLIDAVSIQTKQKYNCIYSCKVYQHFELEIIARAFRRQSEVLTPSGLVIHSFWIGDSVFDDGDMKAIYHDKVKLLEIISEKFEILEQKIYEEFEPGDSLFVIAQKKA